jgi:hypothetical protein
MYLSIYSFINYFFSLSYDRSTAPSKASSPHMRSSASLSVVHYPHFFLMLSSNRLRLLPLLPVPFILPSITCFRRQLFCFVFLGGERRFVLQGSYCSDCKCQRVRLLLNSQVERIWKEVVVTKSRYSLSGSRKPVQA